jgi:phosphoserine phosphatase
VLAGKGTVRVLVLTAESGVSETTAARVAKAMSAEGMEPEPPVRLAGSAVEIAFRGDGDPRPLAGEGLDANVLPADGRRKRLLLADMDSTIIGVECIDELADFAGVKAEVAAITEAAMRGALDFEAALEARVALLKGLSENVLAACYAERVRLNPGARVLVRTMAAHGAETALVSGGFDFFTERVAAEAGFARHQANRLDVAGGRLTGTVAHPILGRVAKRAALETIAAAAGIARDATLAVGDGANDLDMVTAAGLGVAYRGKPTLAAAADARIDHSDLTALLALQGIPEREWCR